MDTMDTMTPAVIFRYLALKMLSSVAIVFWFLATVSRMQCSISHHETKQHTIFALI